eukprot:TRINITY_DN59147_c0_g1_i1.p6 TRINITY_DN59147_c0_g1~~TRINITY_DN59147_c0_g1_i1.p6  ORF type:complete len:125 (-),score=33.37 TRINITY_DN59147_c0_g1_i1:622-963(-)
MRNRTVIAGLLLIVLLFLCAAPALATILRGRVDGMRPGRRGTFPVAQVRIDLIQNMGGQWIRMGVAITGPDGMYYFEGVPPGMFILLLNGKDQYPLQVVPVPMQDIPPLLLMY